MKNQMIRSAIIDKVMDILDNADEPAKLNIGIYADADEVPVIRYSVEEAILEKRGEFD